MKLLQHPVVRFLNPLVREEKALAHHLVAIVGGLLLLTTGAFVGGRTALVNAGLPLGVDISTVGQPNLTQAWFNNAAASGVQFFLVKAGGDDVGEYEDYRFPSYLAWARATGKHVGTYFFASPGADSPQTQANHYAAILNANGGVRVGEITMDDLETGSGGLASFATAFDSTIKSDEGVSPLLYSYQSFFYDHGLANNMSVSGSSYLNDANWYFGTPPNPIPTWNQLVIWQFSDSGCTAGTCPVDQDYQVSTNWIGKTVAPTTSTTPTAPTPTGNLWKLSSNTWVHIPGQAVDIASGPTGELWAVNASHQIWHSSKGDGSDWTLTAGSANEVVVGPRNDVYVLGTNATTSGYGIWKLSGSSWTAFPGSATSLAIDSQDTLWATNAQKEIWHNTSGWTHLPGTANYVAAGASVYVLGTNTVGGGYGIWKWSGGWTALPGGLVDLTVAPDGSLYGANSNHEIYHGLPWATLPGAAIDLTAGPNVVAVGT